MLIVCAIFYQDIDIFCIYCGAIKAVCSLISYFPQYVLIYKNKTTFGWSMSAVWIDCIGASFAVIQVIVDHYDVNSGAGFWEDLNYGKFFLNLVSALCCLVFFFQHYVVYAENNRLMADGKPIKGLHVNLAINENVVEDRNLAENMNDIANDEIMATIPKKMTLGQSDYKPLFGIKVNRRDSGGILQRLSQHKKSIQQVIDSGKVTPKLSQNGSHNNTDESNNRKRHSFDDSLKKIQKNFMRRVSVADGNLNSVKNWNLVSELESTNEKNLNAEKSKFSSGGGEKLYFNSDNN